MDPRMKKRVIVAGIAILVLFIGIIVYALIPKLPSTQASDKTVIIDNYKDYTAHISSDSFGHFGNSLYEYIQNPSQGVYHASIVDGSYSYDPDSWFSTFVIKLKDSDISWDVSIQTLRDGSLNGDPSITCKTGVQCLAVTDKLKAALQDYLPLSSDEYIIAYQKNDTSKISVVYYDQAGEGKTKAQEKIKSLGFNPEDYSIEYFYGGR